VTENLPRGLAPDTSPLLTDLYQLTMLQAYFERGMHAPAVFELFVRKLPAQRNFLVAAGLEQALQYLTSLSFSAQDLADLAATKLFGGEFLDWLGALRFTGDVHTLSEGTIFFPNEPLLRVTAPLPEAQLVESRLVNILHFQTLIASKAARCVLAAPGKTLVDFGMRRAHGSEAAAFAARASYLAGFAGTATVLARPAFGIPLFGTMAHSFVQAHDTESEAFEHFARSHRGPLVLLIDTYDTPSGARRVVELARRLPDKRIDAVRLDSGDLGELAREVRRIFDDAGCRAIRIFASGGLDEHAIAALVASGAPIDGYGVGTSLDVSEDHPALDCVYKLQEYDGQPRRKRSTGKATWPGRKQVYRSYDASGRFDHDVLALEDEPQEGEPLLAPAIRAGKPLAAPAGAGAIRERVRHGLARLPPGLAALDRRAAYRVEISTALAALAQRVDEAFR
jgi:nicotinate phosphoribosyltransferase